VTGDAGHERSDAPPRFVAIGLAGFLMLIGVGALVALAVGTAFEHHRPVSRPNAFQLAAAGAPAPRLEVNGRADRLAIERRAEARLNGYGWADRPAGLARIPIDRAIALQAEQGWPDTANSVSPESNPEEPSP
jgi:hypothetical protein